MEKSMPNSSDNISFDRKPISSKKGIKNPIRLKIVLFIAGLLIITAIVILSIILSNKSNKKKSNTLNSDNGTSIPIKVNIGNQEISYKTKNFINSSVTYSSQEFITTDDDTNVFLVSDGGILYLNNVIITKTSSSLRLLQSGNESSSSGQPPSSSGQPPSSSGQPPNSSGQPGNNDADSYSFYGINSAIVVIGTGKAYLNGVTINTNSYGANAVVATNGGKIEIKNSIITTQKDSSRGIHATYKGVITADNVTISTKGGSCANIATDRGEGTITATNMKLSTNGAGSPLIYSTGSINVNNSFGSSAGAQMVVIEGKNNAKLFGCEFNSTGIGNRNNVDKCGVMIYQSMSGDADVGKGSFESYNSSLTIIKSTIYESTPMFFVTNTEADIKLSNTNISFGSKVFLNSSGTSEWGKIGNNGGKVTLNVTGKTIKGLLSTDNISYIHFYHDSSVSEADYTISGNVNTSKY